MNKFLHAVILAGFGAACGLVWLLMKLPLLLGPGHPLPGFTQLCVSLRPIMIVLPIMATAYCLRVWFRKADRLPSWAGFFAVLLYSQQGRESEAQKHAEMAITAYRQFSPTNSIITNFTTLLEWVQMFDERAKKKTRYE